MMTRMRDDQFSVRSILVNKEIRGTVEPTRVCYDREIKKLIIGKSNGTMLKNQLTVIELIQGELDWFTFYKD